MTHRRSALALTILVLASLSLAGPGHAAPGDLDSSFSSDGKLTIDFEGFPAERAQAVTLRPSDGAILVAGTTHPSGESDDFAYAVVSSTGSGVTEVTHNFGGDTDQQANGILVTPGGLLLAGWSEGDFGLARFDASHQPDPGFGGDGSVAFDFGTNAIGLAVATDSVNRIVVAGITSAGGGQDDFAVARLLPADGSPDDTFSVDGKEVTDFGGADQAYDVAIQPADQKIVVAGFAGPPFENDFALARYHPADGSLDSGFSQDGKQTTDFGGSDHGYAMAIQPDGKILVAGENGLGDFALARYDTDGALDPSFSGDGKETTAFGAQSNAIARGIAVQPDGKIVVAGYAFSGQDTGTDFALARYNPNGTLDTGFSGDGRQTAAIGGGTISDVATDLVIQPDGKIVLAGYTDDVVNGDFAVARFEGGDAGGPPPDADGDGVPDASDACPDVAGSSANGCPSPAPVPPLPGPPPPTGTTQTPPLLDDLGLPVLTDADVGLKANVATVRGVVRLGIPPGATTAGHPSGASQKGVTFVPLTEPRQIPIGSFLDTRRGTVRLRSATGSQNGTQTGDFARGLFQVLQSRRRSARGLTELALKGGSFARSRCRARGRPAHARSAQLSRRAVRRLRSNANGRFRTRGRHSAATVRGTVWETTDRCDGTLTRVTRGSVVVRDLRRRKNIVVRAGRRTKGAGGGRGSYFARAR